MREQLDLHLANLPYHQVFDNGSQVALISDMKSMQEQPS